MEVGKTDHGYGRARMDYVKCGGMYILDHVRHDDWLRSVEEEMADTKNDSTSELYTGQSRLA